MALVHGVLARTGSWGAAGRQWGVRLGLVHGVLARADSWGASGWRRGVRLVLVHGVLACAGSGVELGPRSNAAFFALHGVSPWRGHLGCMAFIWNSRAHPSMSCNIIVATSNATAPKSCGANLRLSFGNSNSCTRRCRALQGHPYVVRLPRQHLQFGVCANTDGGRSNGGCHCQGRTRPAAGVSPGASSSATVSLPPGAGLAGTVPRRDVRGSGRCDRSVLPGLQGR